MTDERNYYGYVVRDPYPGEDAYFQKNPGVAGMAGDDGRIVFNPYAKDVNFDAVGANEAARLWMRENHVTPEFQLTPQQKQYFGGTTYRGDDANARQSLIGRIISGDPSAQDVTEEQRRFAEAVLQNMKRRKNIIQK